MQAQPTGRPSCGACRRADSASSSPGARASSPNRGADARARYTDTSRRANARNSRSCARADLVAQHPRDPDAHAHPAGSLAIGVGAGTTYRSLGGSWILRANVMVRNTGAEPVDVDVRQFHSGEMDVSGDDQSFPGHTSLIPNMTIQGDVAFYIGAGEPKPTTMALTFAVGEAPPVWHADVPLMFSPAPPAHGTTPSAPVYALGVAVPSAVTWLQPDVGRAIQSNPAATNTTSVPLDVPRACLVPALGNDNGSVWNDGSTLPDQLPIATGGRVQGTVAFVFPATATAPTSISVTFGPSNNPQFNQSIPVTAVAPPTPPAS